MAAATRLDLPGWAMGPFTRPEGANPAIQPNPASIFHCPMRGTDIHWEALHTFNPAAIVKDGKVCVLYRAEDDTGKMEIGHHTSRIGLAKSSDGIHFQGEPAPVFYPANDNQRRREWYGGCEDPRIVEDEHGTYVLMYTQYNHKLFRLAVATSPDLVHWTKHGPALSRLDLPWWAWVTKSASIVCELVDGRLKVAKINGKYWMYWGEWALHCASSRDLVHWTRGPVVMRPRPGYFDSLLTEAGPPAVKTKNGIVLIYNGKNDKNSGDPAIPPGTYSCGQACFDPEDPARLIGRLDKPFFKPELELEKTGQYAAGTTFAEGLVFHDGAWFMYYGCADSFVSVAMWKPGA